MCRTEVELGVGNCHLDVVHAGPCWLACWNSGDGGWRCVRALSWRLEGDLGGDGRLAGGRFIIDHE